MRDKIKDTYLYFANLLKCIIILLKIIITNLANELTRFFNLSLMLLYLRCYILEL